MNFELFNTDQGFTLNTLENMMPWEREVYIAMLLAKLQKKKEEQQ
jgi:hypothetical protein